MQRYIKNKILATCNLTFFWPFWDFATPHPSFCARARARVCVCLLRGGCVWRWCDCVCVFYQSSMLCLVPSTILEMIPFFPRSKSLLWIIKKQSSTLLVTSFDLEIIPFSGTVVVITPDPSPNSQALTSFLPMVGQHFRHTLSLLKCFLVR